MVILFGGPFRVNSPGHVAEHNRLATAVPEGGDDTTFLRGDGTWQPGTVSDAGVAALIPDTGTATGAALHAAIGTALEPLARNLALGPRWVFDGDSISVLGSTGEWISEFVARSQGRIRMIADTAVAGRTTTQALIDFETNIRPLAGTVDVVVYEEVTHSITAGLTTAQFLALLDQYLAKVTSIGARMVLMSGFPNNTQGVQIYAFDRAMLSWALKNNVVFIPLYTLSDYANAGAYPAGWSTDGIHPDPNSVAVPQLGQLAWDTVSPLLPAAAAVPLAQYNGEGLFTNGFGITMGGTVTGSISALTLVSTAGALPAGTYTYRIAAGNTSGKGTGTYQEKSITLAAAGGVTLTYTISGSSNKLRIYRKGPSDSGFSLIQSVGAGNGSWTDDGSVPNGPAWVDGDTTTTPAPWGNSGGAIWADAARTQSIDGIRGNCFVLPNGYTASMARATGNYAGLNPRIPVTAGTTIEITFKTRVLITGASPLPTTAPFIRMQFFAGSTSISGGTDVGKHYTDDTVHTFYSRLVVPATADTFDIRMIDSGTPHNGFAIGEVRVDVVPS